MNHKEFLDIFWEYNRIGVDAQGIRVPHAMALAPDDKITAMAMAIGGPNVGLDTFTHMARVLVSERPAKLAFGLDRYSKPGQGVSTADVLSVHYWDGHSWRFGVIEYQYKPSIFLPINWQNANWTQALREEMARAWCRIVAAPGRERSPAMELPLRIAQANDPAEEREPEAYSDLFPAPPPRTGLPDVH